MPKPGFFSTLKGKTVVFIIILSTAALSTLGAMFLHTKHSLLSEFEEERTGIVEHFVIETLKPVMLTGHADIMSSIMESYKRIPDLEGLHIIRTDGVEAFTDGATLGKVNRLLGEEHFRRQLKNPVQVLPPDDPTLAQVVRTEKEKVYSKKTDGGGNITYLMLPIANEPACHGCHGSDHRIRGVLMATFGMTSADRSTLTDISWFFGIAFALLLATAILTYMFITRIMASRVSSIVKQVNTLVANDRFDDRILIDADDEVGQLAIAFNHFISSVELYRVEETKEKERLEKAVFDKTKELREKNTFIEVDLKLASRIQQKLMPEKFPEYPEVDFHAAYIPCLHIGGDYYDVFEMPNRHVGIFMADASGHGSSAALLVSIVKAIVSVMAEHISSPSYIVQLINTTLAKITPDDSFVTLFYGVLDLKTGEMQYSLAGHPPPLVHNRNTGEMTMLQINGGLVGVFDFDKFDDSVYVFKGGDRLVIYTDGIVEACNNGQKLMFGEKKLVEVVKGEKDSSSAEMTAHLLSSLDKFTGGATLADDVTLLVVDFKKQ